MGGGLFFFFNGMRVLHRGEIMFMYDSTIRDGRLWDIFPLLVLVLAWATGIAWRGGGWRRICLPVMNCGGPKYRGWSLRHEKGGMNVVTVVVRMRHDACACVYDFYDAASSSFICFLCPFLCVVFCLNFNVLCFFLYWTPLFFGSSVNKNKKNAMIDRFMIGIWETLRWTGDEGLCAGCTMW